MANKSDKKQHTANSLKGLTELQTEILSELWQYWHENRDRRAVGRTAKQIQKTLAENRRGEFPYQRVTDALALLVERGEAGEGRVGWTTIFVPLKEQPVGKAPGGHPLPVYRLASTGVVSWGDCALLLDELAAWGKTHGDFNRSVLATPFCTHLIKNCGIPNDKTICDRIAYARKHEYMLTDPETEPYSYLMLNDRYFCEQEYVHRIAQTYRAHLALTAKAPK